MERVQLRRNLKEGQLSVRTDGMLPETDIVSSDHPLSFRGRKPEELLESLRSVCHE